MKFSSFQEFTAKNGSQFIKLKVVSPGEFQGKVVRVFSDNADYDIFKEQLVSHHTNSYNNISSPVDPTFNIKIKEGKAGYIDFFGLLDSPQEVSDQPLDLAPHFDFNPAPNFDPAPIPDPYFDFDLPF